MPNFRKIMKQVSLPRHMMLQQFASEMRKRQLEWTAKGSPITEEEMIVDLQDDWKKAKAIYLAAGIDFEELVKVGKEALTDPAPPIVQPPGFDKAMAVVEKLDRKIHIVGKIGRNAPCPCGSGKKYKKCCLK